VRQGVLKKGVTHEGRDVSFALSWSGLAAYRFANPNEGLSGGGVDKSRGEREGRGQCMLVVVGSGGGFV